MKHIFSIGPWLMDLINPPPRESLSVFQKMWRVLLVTVTIVTLCIILALAGALSCYAWQRSREFLEGVPQVRNGLIILGTSAVVNAVCIFTLLQIKKLDRQVIPKAPSREIEVPLPPRTDPLATARD